MNEEVYIKQREYLHRMPGGFPESPTGVEIRLLKKLYTPEEAELFINLKEYPEAVSTIAARIGRNESEIAERLETMAQKGVIFRIRRDGKPLYQAYQFFPGIVEFQVGRVDKEFMELMAEYGPYRNSMELTLENKILRTIPIELTVEKPASIQSYHQLLDMAADEDVIALAPCLCRQMGEQRGDHCEKPLETCLGFGDYGQFNIDNGVARPISISELEQLLKMAEEEGLVIMSTNTQNLSHTCLCCTCHCGFLNRIKTLPQSEDMINIQFHSVIDADLCIQCEECMDRCQIDAIHHIDEVVTVEKGKCIGCGLCLPTCPVKAISLVSNPKAKTPSRDMQEYMNAVKSERGLL